MLASQAEERGRKFKLALRAGLPVLLLISLVTYAVFRQGELTTFGAREILLVFAMMFVTTYFIFFLLEEDSQKALIDPTTNGYNYTAFLHHYQTRKPRSMAVLILDNLGIINENYGVHEVDAMLKSLVYQLDATLAAYDIGQAAIGRKNGANFLIGSDAPESVLHHAIRTFIQEHPSIEEIEINLYFSTASSPDEPLEAVIGRMHDLTVVREKAPDHSPEAAASAAHNTLESKDLEESILQAVRDHRIHFMFRPIFNIKQNQIDTYEIAAKLRLENGQEVLPKVYLPIINRLGFGREYDYVVLKHALDVLPLVDEHISFSFNLSPFSLRNKGFQSKAFALLTQSQITPSRLIVELYERKAHHNMEGYLKTLESFRARGVRICIDNFGSSNASMEYMRHFKFDMVQFDRDYVARLDDEKSRAMLTSMISMSHSLHIDTIAKWVDNEEQKHKLIDLGIDYLQGFGIAKPLTEDQIINTYN